MGNKKVYVIMERWGKYEIDKFQPAGVCESKEVAERHLAQIREKHKKICELAIKDDKFYGLKKEQNRPYTDLQDEFVEYIRTKYFSHLDSDESGWSRDDCRDFNEMIGWWNNEHFRNWCREVKNFSDEVIEATITFNSESGYEDMTYFIAETELLS